MSLSQISATSQQSGVKLVPPIPKLPPETYLDKDFHDLTSDLQVWSYTNAEEIIKILNSVVCQTDEAAEVRLSFWLNEPELICDSGFGAIFKIKLKESQKHCLVLKTGVYMTQNLSHEYYCGLLLNELRKEIPNFCMVFSLFGCSVPVITSDGENSKLMSLFDKIDNNKNHIVMERIESVAKIESLSIQNAALIILQLIYSLYKASRFKFTHWDLHTKNVILRRGKGLCSYTTENGTEWLDCSLIATIIDYGTAHFFHSKRYGFESKELGVMNIECPAVDIYCFCADLSNESEKKDVRDLCKEICKFIVPEIKEDSNGKLPSKMRPKEITVGIEKRAVSKPLFEIAKFIRGKVVLKDQIKPFGTQPLVYSSLPLKKCPVSDFIHIENGFSGLTDPESFYGFFRTFIQTNYDQLVEYRESFKFELPEFGSILEKETYFYSMLKHLYMRYRIERCGAIFEKFCKKFEKSGQFKSSEASEQFAAMKRDVIEFTTKLEDFFQKHIVLHTEVMF